MTTLTVDMFIQIKERSKALDKFKIFKAEVENQHDKRIKIVRSDRGGEYYGRHTPYGQVDGPFAKFLQETGIVAQYSMLGEPQQNGVDERRNRTLMDMVRSMMSYSTLPLGLGLCNSTHHNYGGRPETCPSRAE